MCANYITICLCLCCDACYVMHLYAMLCMYLLSVCIVGCIMLLVMMVVQIRLLNVLFVKCCLNRYFFVALSYKYLCVICIIGCLHVARSF